MRTLPSFFSDSHTPIGELDAWVAAGAAAGATDPTWVGAGAGAGCSEASGAVRVGAETVEDEAEVASGGASMTTLVEALVVTVVDAGGTGAATGAVACCTCAGTVICC